MFYSKLYRCLRVCCYSLLIARIFAVAAPARNSNEAAAGMIRGTVVAGIKGTPLPGARVQLRSETLNLQRRTEAGTDGQFMIGALPAAEDYELLVEADGFRSTTNKNLTLLVGQVLNVDGVLEIAGIEQSVVVLAPEQHIITNASELSQSVNSRQLAELPSNGRSLNRFALLNPRVRQTTGLGSDGASSARLSINASSFRHTYYLLDGSSNYDSVFANAPQQQISSSAVQEFRIISNQFSAEYGGSASGLLMAMTKGGSDHTSGEAFFTGRPSGIQAAPKASSFRVPNELLQFGASAGGPLPVSNSNFFVNYENTRQNRGAFVSSPVPLSYIGRLRNQLVLGRFDHRFSNGDSIYMRVNGNRETNDNPNDKVSGFTQPSAAQSTVYQGAAAQLSLTNIRGRLVNEARASYVNAVPSAARTLNPQISVVRPSYSTSGGSTYSWVRTESYHLSDQVAIQTRRHAWKFGADLLRQKVRDFSVTPFGEYRFASGAPKIGEQPIQYSQTFGTGFIRYGQTYVSAFINDDLRVTSRLTANLGLRYERQSITDDRNNFAPRLGVAYDLTGDGRTIVRGGAGIFYDQYYMYITRRFFLQGFDSPTAAYTLAPTSPGFPAFPNSLEAPPSGLNSDRRDLYLRGDQTLNPYSMQFSFGVQRSIAGGWVATADVIHAHTLKQMRVRDMNAPQAFVRTAPGQRRSVAQSDATRRFQTLREIAVRNVAVVENTGSSVYDALDLGLQRRYGKRFQLEVHYVYSSALTYAMFFGEPNTGVPNDWGTGDRAERGPSDFYQRHRLVAHGSIDLPYRTQLSFISTAASGLPINAVTGVDNNGDTNVIDRPVGIGRNSFRTPPQVSFDISAVKRISLSDRMKLELRADAFNLFNHANYIRLNNVYGDGAAPAPSFLTPVAGVANVDPARQLQFAVRLAFR